MLSSVLSGLQQSGFVSVQLFWIDLSMCYCSKSADKGQGLAEKKRKEKQRGLGILPYENFIIRTVGKYGEFRPCVRTWAVLAILLMTLPEGVSNLYINYLLGEKLCVLKPKIRVINHFQIMFLHRS